MGKFDYFMQNTNDYINNYMKGSSFEFHPDCCVEELSTDRYVFKGDANVENNMPDIVLSMGYEEDQAEEYTNIFFLSIDDAKHLQKILGSIIQSYYKRLEDIERCKDNIRRIKDQLDKGIVYSIDITPVDMLNKEKKKGYGQLLIRIDTKLIKEKSPVINSFSILSERSYDNDDGNFFKRLQKKLE